MRIIPYGAAHGLCKPCDTRPMDDIIHERNGQRGAFVIRRDGRVLAQMTYSVGGVIAIIDHTDVDGALRGTRAGARLVRAAVEWARAEKMQIMPLCPFAKSVFDKTPDYADVLKKQLPALQHQLADHGARFELLVRLAQIGGADRRQFFLQRAAQLAGVEPVGHLAEELMLLDHVGRLE